MKGKIFTQFSMLLLVGLCVLSFRVTAQNGSITGKVLDDKGAAVSYATVVLEGTQYGANTEDDGTFEITNIPPGTYNLKVTYVGFADFKQPVVVAGSPQTINVAMKADYQSLNEVVVVGYGTKQAKDLTGSVTSVSAKDFNDGNVSTPEQLITGKVAGVQITSNGGAPGSGSRIRIRGGSSLNASNDPLIVIDGVPLSNDKINGAPSPLSLINPNDIENMTVLKDASAAAIYGNRAANGVIIITTKKGTAGKFHIGFSSNNSASVNSNYVSILNADQFRSIVDSTHQKFLGNANTNWQKEIYRTAISSDNNLTFNGGLAELPYRLSIEYYNDPGVLKRNQMDRYGASINLNPSFLNNDLKVDLNFKYYHTYNFFSDQSAISSAVNFDPTQPVYSDTTAYGGYWEWIDPKTNKPNVLAPKNPVGLINQKEDKSNVNREIGNLQLNYTLPFFRDLKANLNLGGDFSDSKGTVYVPATAASQFYQGGQNTQYSQSSRNKLLEFYLNYAKELKNINSKIDAIAGYSYQDWLTSQPAFPVINAGGDTITPAPIPTKFQNTLISFYGRLNYTYMDRYLLTATLRDDGSSRFSPDTRWGLFPSVALAWRISDEEFAKDWTALSNLKLRLGYGVTGQQDINSDYPYIPNYAQGTSTAQYEFGGTYYYVLRPDAYDANIKWEQTTTWNAGLDFGFNNGRISGSFDYYYKPTEDLLSLIPVPAGTNFSNNLLTNVGSLTNEGVELTLNFVPVDNQNVRWEIGGNFTYNHNEITKLTKVADTANIGILVGNISGGTGNTIQINSVGFPVNSFYVYQQRYDANGKPIEANGKDIKDTSAYVDRNHDGKITVADKYRYQSPNPKVYAAIYTNISYKNWTASFSIRGQWGGYMYNNVSADRGNYTSVTGAANVLYNIYDSYFYTNFQKPQYFSDYYIQKASFVRMDNISVGYNFKDLLKNKFSLTLSGTVQNAFVITPYKGLDPEIATGIDQNIYPRPRIYSLTLNIQL